MKKSAIDWLNLFIDIQEHGRRWTTDELKARLKICPEKLEIVEGRLLFNEEQRLILLALLLELIGIEKAIQIGHPGVWLKAIEALKNDEEG